MFGGGGANADVVAHGCWCWLLVKNSGKKLAK